MKSMRSILHLCCLLVFPYSSEAWWDTRLEVTRPTPPADQEFPAIIGKEATRETDTQANGGKGGQVDWLARGGKAISRTIKLKPGLYSWSAICRLRETGLETPVFKVTLSQKGKELEHWILPGRMGGYYGAVTFYIPIQADGEYTISFALEGEREKLLARAEHPRPDGSTFVRFEEKDVAHILQSMEKVQGVLVDRFELANVLSPKPLQQRKKARFLSTERAMEILGPDALKPRRKGELKVDITSLWDRLPGFNELTTQDRDGFSGYRMSTLRKAVGDYHKSQSDDDALYASLMLCGLAERWPAVQYTANFLAEHAFLSKKSAAPWSTNTANMVGKTVYRGWAPSATMPLLASYDLLFDFIAKSPELLEAVNAKLPYIKTHDDLIAFLDERLLWSSARDCKRGWISSDLIPPLIAEILGPGPDADEVLRSTVFDRIQTNMAHLGGIDDQAVTSFTRDGVHYISSAVYFNASLGELGTSLSGYRKLGGDAAFDLLSLPEGRSAILNPYTLSAIKVAGGFRLINGDGGSYDRTPEKEYQPHPSRVLGGTGYTILETGQTEDDPLKARAIGIYWGGGRGHAHCDTLNIELFAHGCRMAPDLGGRDEGKREGFPNMRSSRVHNLVEVDDKNFWNKGLSIMPASGWLVSFAPARQGSQFTEHGAAALSHPQVSIYQRQTAMINVPGPRREDSYIFDVFRVSGGKSHSYNFHGGDTEAIRTNLELRPAEKHPFLRKHKDGTRFEGFAGEVMEAEWPLRPSTQKGYQKQAFEAEYQPVTRLFLLGQDGVPALIGNAFSKHYKYDYPFFSLRKHSKTELNTVFPAVIELYAGTPFIKAVRPLEVPSGDALGATAIEVETVSGRNDFLFSSGNPDNAATIGDKRAVTGRFALVAAYGEELDEARLVGGTQLRTSQVVIEVPKARLNWKINKVDYPNRKLELDQPISSAFKDATVLINNGSRLHAFNLESVDGKGATLKEYPGYYKANLLRMGADDTSVTGELEAGQFAWDPPFAHNTVLTNEDHSQNWRVKAFEDDGHWMTIGYPGYRWSFPIEAAENDFPDLDGDGRRTATLEAIGDRELPEPGRIEIVRVDGDRIGFRIPEGTPENARIQQGGWAMDGLVMVPEGGKQRFYTRYSGRNMRWRLQSPISKDQLNDPNNDQKKKLYAFVFGEGDTMEADASVQIRHDRKENVYIVETNTPAKIGLSLKDKAEVVASYGSHEKAPLQTDSRDGFVFVEITPAMVEAGLIRITTSNQTKK